MPRCVRRSGTCCGRRLRPSPALRVSLSPLDAGRGTLEKRERHIFGEFERDLRSRALLPAHGEKVPKADEGSPVAIRAELTLFTSALPLFAASSLPIAAT